MQFLHINLIKKQSSFYALSSIVYVKAAANDVDNINRYVKVNLNPYSSVYCKITFVRTKYVTRKLSFSLAAFRSLDTSCTTELL